MEIVVNIYIFIMVVFVIIYYMFDFLFKSKLSFREIKGGNFIYNQPKMLRYSSTVLFFGTSTLISVAMVVKNHFDFMLLIFGILTLYVSFYTINIQKIIINKEYFTVKRLFTKDTSIKLENLSYELKREWAYKAGYVLRLYISYDNKTKQITANFTEPDLYNMVKILDKYKALRENKL
ncbi:hypothetical protein [Campylobacter corcagiensis]|uniref:Uncharacterized protein n=1 Tax=Campylobacter corcagiensis TaxID=1448857 RepID=A0A7M1LHC4_9BACT|nr:hypothetical protein [Campylobacter corcagiensis]QKF65434.1 putative membrane protein [Campylobacter corcagiensis]QOQ87992.1 hypothetical protein IMC76_04135 [Campylobacter corcagiensis]